MRILIGISCIGCAACTDACPMGALFMNEDNIAECDHSQCVLCGSCVNMCPVGNISIVELENKDDEHFDFFSKNEL